MDLGHRISGFRIGNHFRCRGLDLLCLISRCVLLDNRKCSELCIGRRCSSLDLGVRIGRCSGLCRRKGRCSDYSQRIGKRYSTWC